MSRRTFVRSAGSFLITRCAAQASHCPSIICCSEIMKAKIDSNPLFAGKTVILRNFAEPAAQAIPSKKDYILYFGRFSAEKRIRTLLRACSELPEIPFVFAGSGPLEAEIRSVPNANCVGFQRGEALQKLIREAKFSICPSECHENCPFSVIESLTLATPVLGSNMGGIPELIQSGRTGELFEGGNAEDLKRRIQKLWSDRQLIELYAGPAQ